MPFALFLRTKAFKSTELYYERDFKSRKLKFYSDETYFELIIMINGEEFLVDKDDGSKTITGIERLAFQTILRYTRRVHVDPIPGEE